MIRRLLLASLGAFFRNRLWRACCRSISMAGRRLWCGEADDDRLSAKMPEGGCVR